MNDWNKIFEWLKGEYNGIRTGRAAPSILDTIRVESYGAKVPLNQVAGINVEDAFTIRISPWDKAMNKPIESSIQQSGLGLSAVVDDRGVRVVFPKLTDETRQMLAKVVKQKLEEARIRVRNERQKALTDMKNLDEDAQERGKQKLQKEVDDINKKLEDLSDKKEQEINS